MYGAMIGDIVGSKYEFRNIKTKDFPLFSRGCDYTDDTVMTAAVANAILRSCDALRHDKNAAFCEILVAEMQAFGRRYPYPTGAYGGHFALWLREKHPKPYGSYGNGSAMRVSPCGLIAVSLEEAKAIARASAAVTHNHPEGIKGAEAVAAAIFLAKSGKTKEEIRAMITEEYYPLDFTLDSIRAAYQFDGSCQGTVPQALEAFFESTDFEDAVRNAISIGGDSDTIGAITGSVAWAYYAAQRGALDDEMLSAERQACACLPEEFVRIADEFHDACLRRAEEFSRSGCCDPVMNPEETQRFQNL